MVIPFPIAFFVGTFLADVAYWYSANLAWAAATLWLLGAGLVMAALAAVLGLTDVFGDSQIRALPPVWWHASGNVLVVLIELFNFYFRYDQGAAFIVPKGVGLSFVASLLLIFTGWKGGEMIFRGHAGVSDG
jgi:uncharacterized membrane protein